MTLIAKPVVKNQYWIVTDGKEKVGNVIADGSGFEVKLNGNKKHFKTTNAIKRQTSIEFEQVEKQKPVPPLSSFPTPSKTYNNVLDLKRKLHIFTKSQKSKCYHAAGYFVLNQGEPSVVFCPKYIFVQRYEYSGPYKTESEAKIALNKL
jgi:hypothetical protein